MLFVAGVLLGTALQLWASEKERVGQGGSIQSSDDEGTSASTSGVRAQVWLGFAGTVLAALIALIGTLFGGQWPLYWSLPTRLWRSREYLATLSQLTSGAGPPSVTSPQAKKLDQNTPKCLEEEVRELRVFGIL